VIEGATPRDQAHEAQEAPDRTRERRRGERCRWASRLCGTPRRPSGPRATSGRTDGFQTWQGQRSQGSTPPGGASSARREPFGCALFAQPVGLHPPPAESLQLFVGRVGVLGPDEAAGSHGPDLALRGLLAAATLDRALVFEIGHRANNSDGRLRRRSIAGLVRLPARPSYRNTKCAGHFEPGRAQTE